jgi:D-alanyl-D-alanine carboxypeptidase
VIEIRPVRVVLFALLAVLSAILPAWANPQLLVNTDNGEILFEEDAGLPWHPASLTKLMTAYVTFQAISDGRASLSTPVIVSRAAVNVAPSKSGLAVDSAISMEDALYILLVKSANDIAVAVAETVSGSQRRFVAEMNATAERLGLSATHYVNPHGLHDPDQVTSARDLAVLALAIRARFPQYLPIFATEEVVLGRVHLETNNDLLSKFAGTTGMKTGYVCSSGLNIVATVERGGAHFMAIVLGGSSARERGEMTAQMVLRALAGRYPPTGRSVTEIVNAVGTEPADMRPMLCGKNAADYVAQREAAFPFGLKGQPTGLTDDISGPVHVATNLGRLRDVPLPRPRPIR